MSIFGDFFKKEVPLLGLQGSGGGLGYLAGGSGAGASVPQISTYDELFSSKASQIDGELTHNGYGFMLYTGYKVDDSNFSTLMDVSNIDTVRFVLMGGGGGGADVNITCGSSSGGIEGWIDTSNITQLQLKVGGGGQATCTTVGGSGGDSSIHVPNGSGGWTRVAYSLCGRGVGGTNYATTRRGTGFDSAYVTAISRTEGALGGDGSNNTKSDREPVVVLSPTLSGAHAHGACSGRHATDQSSDVALGYGGGGPGTHGYGISPGGPLLSYAGGNGSSSSGTSAEGPTVSFGTSYGRNSINCSGYTHPLGGGGGGAFGAPGMEVYDVGEGATGLVKVWWASNTGDSSVLTTVGNLYT